jgi:carbohydrate-selective porin OprB
MKRTDTNRSGGKGGANDLQRTTSSYHGSVADGIRYSDRLADREDERNRLTASQINKSKTLEERLRQAERENASRRG